MSHALLYMLDTNTVSYLVSARSPSIRRTYLETESHATVALSAITEGEIRFGLEKRPGATRLWSTFQDFFASVQVLPWTSEVAQAYGKLRAGLNATGRNLALMDLLIVSHAIAAGAILVTHDQAFQHVSPFLTIVDWAPDI